MSDEQPPQQPTAPPDAAPGHPAPGSTQHGFFWYLIALSIELLTLFSLFSVTYYTVSRRSGLNEPDKVRRIWARAPEIRYQPVVRPLVFSVAVSYGAQTVLLSLVHALFALIGIQFHGYFDAFLLCLALGASAYISVIIFRATSNDGDWKKCASATLLFDTFAVGVVLNLSIGIYKRVARMINSSSSAAFFLIIAANLVFLLASQTPFYLMAAMRPLPATARLIYNNQVVPNWVKLDRTVLMVSAPLAVIYIVAYIIEFRLPTETYTSRVVSALAVLMVLSAAALASIISVNRALLANEFQWHWRAFLTPAIPIGAIDLFVHLIRVISGHASFSFLLFQVPHLFLSVGSAGALGAYFYLICAERYAQAHVDEDLLAQDDLLGDFEEDADNTELEV